MKTVLHNQVQLYWIYESKDFDHPHTYKMEFPPPPQKKKHDTNYYTTSLSTKDSKMNPEGTKFQEQLVVEVRHYFRPG